jgi:hypothetical protein
MTMMTVTLRNSGERITIDVEDVAHFSKREWGTILHFIPFVDTAEGEVDIAGPADKMKCGRHSRKS